MTQQVYYFGLFALSLIMTFFYVIEWRRHFDVHMAAAFTLIPIANLAYYLMYSSGSAEVADAALKIVYIGGSILPWLLTMCVAALCGIGVPRPVRVATFSLNALIYLFVLTVGRYPFFYRSLTMERVGDAFVARKEYGPVHTVYYAVVIAYLVAEIAVIAYSYRKKKQISRRVLFLLFIPVLVTIAGYFANRFFAYRGIELVPLAYVLAQFVYLLIVRRMVLYNVSETVIDSQAESGDVGFVTFDLKKRYLGCNETARRILPALSSLTVDRTAGSSPELDSTVTEWLGRFTRDEDGSKKLYSARDGEEEKIYTVSVGYLTEGKKRYGYKILLEDDTQNQKYIRLLDRYNSDLQADVAAKTERIVEMHDRLVLGMATMVESRDNSTGGHIRRTSEGIRILIDAMRERGDMPFSESFCRNLIKAAPMHDLGKIAVDDAVLRKAGPFTEAERLEMQKHAAEGARIVRSILEDTDDEEFKKIAENVAHYHHERVDGSGYPDGLRGDGIPPEARIMAIADVYDALVSRRVYKEKFSFEEADRIIREGMGTQFDARLLPYYEAARPKLEAYYSVE